MAFNKKLTLEGLQYYHSKLKSLLFDKVDKEDGKGLSTNDYTTLEKDKLNGISIGAEVNQNAFSNILIDSTTITANSKTDILKIIAGTDITLISDINENAITISSSNTTYSAGTGISLSGTTFSNSGVRSIATGSSNGTISVNTNGTTANVAVYGLGSAAYTDSSAYATASHTHNYLSRNGGTVTGSLTVSVNANGQEGTITAHNLRVNGDTISGFSRNDITSTTTFAIKGNCYIYNSMGGHTSLKTDLVGSTATNTVYLPSTDGTLTTSAGKSATYTSSLSSGSDTLFTQAGAYAMYSELNSNLGNIFNLNKVIPLETNMNNLVKSENSHVLKMARYNNGSCLNTPLTQGIDGAGEGIVFSFCNSTLYATQICSPMCSEHIYLRYCAKGTFSSWKVLA